MKIWIEQILSGDIATGNAAVKATGPLVRDQAELIADFFALKLGTVQAYWSPNNKRGLLVKAYIGVRPAAINPDTQIQIRRRIFMACMLQTDGGLARDPLYTGKTSRFTKTFATLEECGYYMEDVIGGAWDSGMGFRLSKAWTNLIIMRQGGTNEEWTCVVVYNGLGSADESDPAEPFAAYTIDGELQPGDGEPNE